ncbi:iron-sulfur cluster assembly scaffold protein IscU isoform X3 [Metopolophium dirhodum]|uniref:iron-sulfur cluster assembly scaffold protein IscU isoform X3 n=1 Tax=Metopolophium dirhodum TaxID=44670 RepID=UPI00298FF850|nr:iron-sulfur cluster assembly scaffold protein IscU isoform X3 [Metopolophium dirhodum]
MWMAMIWMLLHRQTFFYNTITINIDCSCNLHSTIVIHSIQIRTSVIMFLNKIPKCLTTKANSVPCLFYHKNVIDHYENPRNVGTLNKNDKNVGTGLVGAPACGDVMKLQIKVNDSGRIVDAKFKTFGCGSAIASSSLATEWVMGKTVDEALSLKNTDIAKELSLPPVKLHCSMLAEDAIKAALSDYRIKQQEKKKSEDQE